MCQLPLMGSASVPYNNNAQSNKTPVQMNEWTRIYILQSAYSPTYPCMIKQVAAQLHNFFHKQTTPVLVAVKMIEM